MIQNQHWWQWRNMSSSFMTKILHECERANRKINLSSVDNRPACELIQTHLERWQMMQLLWSHLKTNEKNTGSVSHADRSDADSCLQTLLLFLTWPAEACMYCKFQSSAACLCYILLWAASLTTGNKGSIEQRQRRGALMGNLHAFVEGNWSWVKGNRCN